MLMNFGPSLTDSCTGSESLKQEFHCSHVHILICNIQICSTDKQTSTHIRKKKKYTYTQSYACKHTLNDTKTHVYIHTHTPTITHVCMYQHQLLTCWARWQQCASQVAERQLLWRMEMEMGWTFLYTLNQVGEICWKISNKWPKCVNNETKYSFCLMLWQDKFLLVCCISNAEFSPMFQGKLGYIT